MTAEIFNDQLFDSLESQIEFQARTAHLPEEEVQRLRSVLGRPSQFVGRVMNYASAVRHWKEWQEYTDRESPHIEALATGKPLPEEKRGPGRPRLNAEPLAATRKYRRDPEHKARVDQASKEWHEAIAQCKELDESWNRYVQAQVDAIRKQAADAKAQRDEYVRVKREAYRALRDLED
jgi:hypothetical protein